MDAGEQMEQYIVDVLEPLMNEECTSVNFDEYNITLKDLNYVLSYIHIPVDDEDFDESEKFASELDLEAKVFDGMDFIIYTICRKYKVEGSLYDGIKSFSKV